MNVADYWGRSLGTWLIKAPLKDSNTQSLPCITTKKKRPLKHPQLEQPEFQFEYINQQELHSHTLNSHQTTFSS